MKRDPFASPSKIILISRAWTSSGRLVSSMLTMIVAFLANLGSSRTAHDMAALESARAAMAQAMRCTNH